MTKNKWKRINWFQIEKLNIIFSNQTQKFMFWSHISWFMQHFWDFTWEERTTKFIINIYLKQEKLKSLLVVVLNFLRNTWTFRDIFFKLQDSEISVATILKKEKFWKHFEQKHFQKCLSGKRLCSIWVENAYREIFGGTKLLTWVNSLADHREELKSKTIAKKFLKHVPQNAVFGGFFNWKIGF